MQIEIDDKSGFCFGVQNAIKKVEELTKQGDSVNCLGELLHNHEEIERLEKMGMRTVDLMELSNTSNQTILIRTHGEPPSTYQQLRTNNNTIIDATCPVVLKLQKRIKTSSIEVEKTNGQLLIFGKKGHAEVVGLNGQTGNKAIIISSLSDLDQIDFNRPIELYCQTTMPLTGYGEIKDAITQKAKNKVNFHDTICRQVANRVPHIEQFAKRFDVVIFVSGKNSSNGKLLFEMCKKGNLNSYFISSPDEVEGQWFKNIQNVGICGATSTPKWLMEQVKERIETL
ncbi:MAG TPA: 4-hydroxy-3-methylbut-2-enyl diphosphate reductase [Prolixibacteraceae bacterium]|nr:4-hydroxy-3-methylbut-2-enyl diphosphate reductase [Prolixibacteraceae bacterium]